MGNFLKGNKNLLMVCCLLFFGACKQSEFYDKSQLLNAENGSLPASGTEAAPAAATPVADAGGSTVDEPALCQNGSTDNLICNPLAGGQGANPATPTTDVPAVPASKLGLIAHLYEGQSNWNNLGRYFVDGYKHQEDMYFSNFDVANRAFTEGFGTATDYLKNSNGDKLIEWFAISAVGNLALPDSEEVGYYHIATISDDGVKVTVNGRVIIDNSNIHSATIDCATELVQLTRGEAKSFELGYFQGPRTYIALQTFIKKIDDVAAFKKESYCSTGYGPNMLTTNGYKIISPAWFTLPAGY